MLSICPNATIFQQAAPLLVPLIENNGVKFADPILRSYLKPLLRKNIDTLILGCTDEIISAKLGDYLARHPEMEKRLSKNKRREFLVSGIAKKEVGVFIPQQKLDFTPIQQRQNVIFYHLATIAYYALNLSKIPTKK